MRRRDSRLGLAALLLAAATPAPAQPVTPAPAEPPALDNWYRVELLVFARRDPAALTAEAFDPLPELSYPQDYRFLIEPQLADRRFDDFAAYRSAFDARGVQRLTLPRAPSGVDTAPRPDMQLDPDDLARLSPPEAASDGAAAPDAPAIPEADSAAPGTAQESLETQQVEGIAAAVDPDAPLLAAPYQLLPAEALEFRYQAAMLRRRGSDVLFHGAWWAPFEDRDAMLPIVLDRGGDPESRGWPELQGSLLLYLSRYLHLELDLWLNTAGDYLPQDWQIPAPPLPRQSWAAGDLASRVLDPYAAPPTLDELLGLAVAGLEPPRPDGSLDGRALGMDDGGDPSAQASYHYRHAIVHRQTRRMRSGELHYLDHPVLGVVIRLQPVGEEFEPWVSAQAAAFFERHQLPVTRRPAATADPES
jgi:hypothetical protein